MERDPQFYIDKGFLDVGDEPEFRIMADAASCFGREYKGLQQSFIPNPSDFAQRLWFPKFYPTDGWSNVFSDNEETITEKCLDRKKAREHMDNVLSKKSENRLVFARTTGSSGKLMYIFKGEYKIDLEVTNYERGFVHRRIATVVKTYPHR
jgi:hypothetical protein